jgi:hypothetical protein
MQQLMADFGIEKSFASGNRQLTEHHGFGLSARASRNRLSTVQVTALAFLFRGLSPSRACREAVRLRAGQER